MQPDLADRLGLTVVSAAQARLMSEKALEQHVQAICDPLRVKRYHHLRSKGSEPGWPDDVLVGPGGCGLLYRELKKQDGKVTVDQQAVLDALASNGQDVGVWRPTDLVSGRIFSEILAISPLRGRLGTPRPAGSARQ